MIRPAIVFISLILLATIITSAAVVEGNRSGEISKKIITPMKNSLLALEKSLSEPPKESNFSDSNTNAEVEVYINQNSKTSVSPTPTQAPVQTQAAPAKPCNRYTVVHLDGSTSNLCYSTADYNQLVNLGYDLSSAKSFYQFHLDGAQGYQDEKDRTGSDFWLGAKASQEQQAKREQEKIGQITLEMQAIESRGY